MNIPTQSAPARRINMSHLGKSGLRSQRASTGRIAALLLGNEPLPPRRERIDDEIARLGGTAEGHIQLRRVFVDDPTRDIFFLAPQVMITGFVIAAGLPPTRERANIDRGFTVHAQAFDLLRVLARGVFFL